MFIFCSILFSLVAAACCLDRIHLSIHMHILCHTCYVFTIFIISAGDTVCFVFTMHLHFRARNGSPSNRGAKITDKANLHLLVQIIISKLICFY